jgi:hypothetical protein
MNTTLTEMRENGSKTETKVFAGGAVIAKQYDNPQTPDFVRWIHADPVTGSRQEVQKNGVGEDWLRTELEPLGQEIQPIKPDEELPTGTTVSNNSADSPEWLCKIQYKDYWEMPVACQRARNEDVTDKLEELNKIEGNAKAITAVDSPITSPAIPFMDSPVGGKSNPLTLALRESASSTTKKTKDNQSDDDEPIVIETRERKIPGFKDASFAGDDDNLKLVNQAIADVKSIFGSDNECTQFFGLGKIATIYSTENGKSSVENIYKIDPKIVANHLGEQLRQGIGFLDAKNANSTQIGIEQSGKVSDYTDGSTEYRSFERVKVNIKGNFLGSGKFGSYSGRVGRALAFLHEIAHLIYTGKIRDNNGKVTGYTYLIPDDGNLKTDENGKILSEENTKLVESKCKVELDNLKKSGN